MPLDELAGAANLLRDAADVTLLAHVNPDADALGSAIALGTALKRRGATVRVSFGRPDRIPETLRDLDRDGLVVPARELPPNAGLVVALDCGGLGRLGPLAAGVAATIAAGGNVLVVDHHASNTRFGTHHLVDDQAEATAVLVLRLLDELGTVLDEQLARCLYAGLMTDTSRFSRATPGTHRMAARLVEAGADAEALARQLYGSHPFAWMRMLAAVLGRARLEPDVAAGAGLVHTVVHLSDLDGVRTEDVDAVIDLLHSTVEAEVAVVLKEVEPNRWSGSLRAVGKVDVSAVAARLGGGGHRLAAGFTASGTADEILLALRAALAEPVMI